MCLVGEATVDLSADNDAVSMHHHCQRQKDALGPIPRHVVVAPVEIGENECNCEFGRTGDMTVCGLETASLGMPLREVGCWRALDVKRPLLVRMAPGRLRSSQNASRKE
jgi:hypothetical protein